MSFQSNNQIRLTFDSVTFDSYDSYVTYENIEKFTEDLLNLIKYKGLDNESTIQQLNFILDQLDILDPIEIEEEYMNMKQLMKYFHQLLDWFIILSECPYYSRNENIKKELNKIVNVSYGNTHNFE